MWHEARAPANPTQPTFVALHLEALATLHSAAPAYLCCLLVPVADQVCPAWPFFGKKALYGQQLPFKGPGWLCVVSNGSKKMAKAGWGWWNVGGQKAQTGGWGDRLVGGVKAPLQLLEWMGCQAPEF